MIYLHYNRLISAMIIICMDIKFSDTKVTVPF